jgi:hypothetical protein
MQGLGRIVTLAALAIGATVLTPKVLNDYVMKSFEQPPVHISASPNINKLVLATANINEDPWAECLLIKTTTGYQLLAAQPGEGAACQSLFPNNQLYMGESAMLVQRSDVAWQAEVVRQSKIAADAFLEAVYAQHN